MKIYIAALERAPILSRIAIYRFLVPKIKSLQRSDITTKVAKKFTKIDNICDIISDGHADWVKI